MFFFNVQPVQTHQSPPCSHMRYVPKSHNLLRLTLPYIFIVSVFSIAVNVLPKSYAIFLIDFFIIAIFVFNV